MRRKTTVQIFQATNRWDYTREDLFMVKNVKFQENEALLIAAQNNAVRTNYVKAKIDNTQQNNKCGLCRKRDETINHIVSKCNKLA